MGLDRFVVGGLESAIEQVRAAANGEAVAIAGGGLLGQAVGAGLPTSGSTDRPPMSGRG